MTRNSDNAVLNKNNSTNLGKIEIDSVEWYVPHYTPSVPQKATLSEQNLSKIPTELHYVERSVLKKEIKTQIYGSLNQEKRKSKYPHMDEKIVSAMG